MVEKRKSIEKGEELIAKAQNRLDYKIKQLRSSYKLNKITKNKLNAKISKLKKQSDEWLKENHPEIK